MPFPPPGDPPDPGIEPVSPADLPDPGIELGFPPLKADVLPTELSGKPSSGITSLKIFQVVVIYTVKGFRVVNEAEVDVF